MRHEVNEQKLKRRLHFTHVTLPTSRGFGSFGSAIISRNTEKRKTKNSNDSELIEHQHQVEVKSSEVDVIHLICLVPKLSLHVEIEAESIRAASQVRLLPYHQ